MVQIGTQNLNEKCYIIRYIIYINVIYHYTLYIFLALSKISLEMCLYVCQHVLLYSPSLANTQEIESQFGEMG